MRAGRLRKRLILQQPILAGDGMGGGTYSWEDIATLWADVTTTSASNAGNIESFTTDQFRTMNHFVVKIRYRTDISTQMRFSFNGRILEILSIVTQDERNWETHLLCREGG